MARFGRSGLQFEQGRLRVFSGGPFSCLCGAVGSDGHRRPSTIWATELYPALPGGDSPLLGRLALRIVVSFRVRGG